MTGGDLEDEAHLLCIFKLKLRLQIRYKGKSNNQGTRSRNKHRFDGNITFYSSNSPGARIFIGAHLGGIVCDDDLIKLGLLPVEGVRTRWMLLPINGWGDLLAGPA